MSAGWLSGPTLPVAPGGRGASWSAAEEASAGALVRVPPEGWERARDRLSGWLGRRPRVVRVLTRVAQVSQVASVVLLGVALLVIEGLAEALVPAVSLLAGLGVLVLVARTRTVRLRSLTVLLSVSTVWALLVALFTAGVGRLVGLTTSDDGAPIALAAFIEEPGKLLILLVPALVAPGRMRRLAASDWMLLGYAAGAGFTVAEDFARRISMTAISPWLSLLAELLGTGTSYSLNPLTSGSFQTGVTVPWTGEWGQVMVVGHQVSTMLVASTVGLGMWAWRHAGHRGAGAATPWWRLVAVGGPAAALAWAVMDHAAYNATVASAGWTQKEGLLLGVVKLVWLAGGMGRGQMVLAVVALGACLVVDAHRRLLAGPLGTLGEGVGVVPELSGLAAPWRAPVRAVVALGVLTWADLTVTAAGYAQPGLTRRARMRAGRRTGRLVMEVRRQAMGVTVPGAEPAARRRWALAALAIAVVVALVCLGVGGALGRVIGPDVIDADDTLFFAGLLDSLASWWDSLGLGGQILLTALGVVALMSLGASGALALGAFGVFAWAAEHGHGVADFMRDPRQATVDYLRTVTLGQLLWDVLDFATTFIPGSALGLGARSAARSLEATVALRRNVDDLVELSSLFEQRSVLTAARNDAVDRLRSLLPEGTTMRDFTRRNYKNTLRNLHDAGYRSYDLDRLRQAARTVHQARPRVTRAAEVAGEVGGVQDLTRRGYEIPDAFRPQGLAGKPTGPRRVDMLAVSSDGTSIHVPELKGGTSRLNTGSVPTTFEGDALQGTPAYVRDHLLTDPRVIELFRDNPGIWHGVRSGRIAVTSEVISTPNPFTVLHSHPIDVDLASYPQIIAAIEDKIAALGPP